MARTASISPLGLYNWDNTIFDLMQVPEELDKDVLVKNILYSTAELEVLYPNPVVFKNLVALWSAKNQDVWQRLYNTTQYEYNPIENYNRYEEGTTESEGTRTHSGTDTRNIDREMGGSDTTTGEQTAGHWIAGFDSQPVSAQDDGLVKQTRDEANVTNTTNYGGTEDVTDTLRHGEQIADQNEGTHTLHAHGNIGVTTTQKLIKEQRQIDLFNPYDIIIEDFKMKFCILVY